MANVVFSISDNPRFGATGEATLGDPGSTWRKSMEYSWSQWKAQSIFPNNYRHLRTVPPNAILLLEKLRKNDSSGTAVAIPPSSVIPVDIKSLFKVAHRVLYKYDVKLNLISAWKVRVCRISEQYFPNFSRSPEAKWRYGRSSRHNWRVSSAEYFVKLGNKAMQYFGSLAGVIHSGEEGNQSTAACEATKNILLK